MNPTLEKLKKVFPDAVTEIQKTVNGRTVIEYALKPEFLDELQNSVDFAEDKNRYELMFPGKQWAKQQAKLPINKALKPKKSESKNWDSTQNLYIEGDNIHALKLLRETYKEKVKMIYIDPPYNTGSDGFVYNDDFSYDSKEYLRQIGSLDEAGEKVIDSVRDNLKGRKHAGWLAFMLPRLMIARELLREDGVIFISIDDNEVHNLRNICDEVFGGDNFIAQMIWQRAFSPKNDAKFISNSHDYILMYAKSIFEFKIGRLPRTEQANARYTNPDNDPRGVWTSSDISVKTYNADYDYPITTPSGKIVEPPSGRCWRTNKSAFQKLVDDNRIYFGEEGANTPRIKRFLSELKFEGMAPTSIFLHKDVGHSQEGSQELTKLLGAGAFEGPKPVRLLIRLLILANTVPNDIILDFFSGSATTAHAVMKLNAEDGGNRKYIMVQLDEACDPKSEAFKAGYKTIPEIGKERIRRAEKHIREEIQAEIDKLRNGKKSTDDDKAKADQLEQNLAQTDFGFRNFEIVDSVLKIPQKTIAEMSQQELDSLTVRANDDNRETMLTEAMLLQCVPLDLPIAEHITDGGYHYYIVDRKLFLVDNDLAPDVLEVILAQHGDDFDEIHYLLDSLSVHAYYTAIEHLANESSKTIHRI